MGEPIPLSILVGGKERREDLAYIHGHDGFEAQSPVLSDLSFASSPTMTEQRKSHDLESGRQSMPAGKTDPEFSSDEVVDPNVVSWDGPNDPANPINWSSGSKWGNIAVISAITFITFVP